MKTSEVLIEARKLIADEANWIKGRSKAVNAFGEFCYCSTGAVEATIGDSSLFWSAVDALTEASLTMEVDGVRRSIIGYNDDPDTTHTDVLAVFDEAIRKAQQAEARALWVEALRSGEYEQTKERLKRGNSFCCLGVACEVAVAEGVVETYDGSRTGLPPAVQAWLGVDHEGTTSVTSPKLGGREFLTSLNDTWNLTFAEIADLIEEGVVITQ